MFSPQDFNVSTCVEFDRTDRTMFKKVKDASENLSNRFTANQLRITLIQFYSFWCTIRFSIRNRTKL